MELETARIPARSRREALDWSLVLLSQGIEPVIAYEEDTATWGLIVSAENHGSAEEAIRLYQLENRRWPWRRELFQPGLLFDWGSLAWAALLLFFYCIDTRIDLRSAGIMDSAAVSHRQWWRLFTAIWLHGDLAHLAGNAVIGFILLGLVMARYGTGAGLLAAYLAGAGGNLIVWLAFPSSHLSLGASGMVMGALGLLAAQTLTLWKGEHGGVAMTASHHGKKDSDAAEDVVSRTHNPGGDSTRSEAGDGMTPSEHMTGPPRPFRARRPIASGVLGGVLLFLLLGLAPGTDVVAHAGGFSSGIILGALTSLTPGLAHRTKANLVCGLVFLGLVLWPWWHALEGH
jgi:membrane associated rhomboid family serine protease